MTTNQDEVHKCCDGECNHDDCCGKIPENCPLRNQDEVREEFKAKLGNKLAYIGDSGQKHLDDVADWWLSKFDTFLAKKREAIEKMETDAITDPFGNEQQFVTKAKVLSILT